MVDSQQHDKKHIKQFKWYNKNVHGDHKMTQLKAYLKGMSA